jgi:hypothetical protein
MRHIFFIRTAASSFEASSGAKETAVSVVTKLRRYGEYYEKAHQQSVSQKLQIVARTTRQKCLYHIQVRHATHSSSPQLACSFQEFVAMTRRAVSEEV